MFYFASVCERFDVIDESFKSAIKTTYLDCIFDYSYTTLALVLSANFIILVLFLWSIMVLSGFLFQVTPVQLFFYFFVAFSFEIVKKQVGSAGFLYYPFLFTLFIYILFSNVLGLLPWMFSASSSPVVTSFLSLSVWLLGLLVGFLVNGVGFYKVVVPSNVPIFMLPFLILVETVSYCIRIFSLSIRLAANVTAGHILLITIAGFVISLFSIWFLFSFLAWIVLAALYLLEIGIMLLQVYVFITLACIYLNDSLNLSH